MLPFPVACSLCRAQYVLWGTGMANLGSILLEGMRPDFFSRPSFTSLMHRMSASA